MLIALFGSLACLEIEYVECASYILIENPDVPVNLNEPISESNADQVQDTNINLCCSNTSCIYDMVEKALKHSKEFASLKNILSIYNYGERLPDIILIDVQAIWTEYDNSTQAMLDHIYTHNMSYIHMGGNSTQSIFQTCIYNFSSKVSHYSVQC